MSTGRGGRGSRIALLALVLLFLPLHVSAQLPDAPAERYVDADPTARAFHPGPGSKAGYRQVIQARLRKNPRDAEALAQRAYLHYAGGYAEQGDRDYARALEVSVDDPQLQRRVHWSWGWSLLNAGQPAQALEHWQRSEAMSGGRPFWIPYTNALAFWQLGQKDLALAYYAAAVRSDSRWGTPEGVAEMTEHWRDGEKAVLAEIIAASRIASPVPEVR